MVVSTPQTMEKEKDKKDMAVEQQEHTKHIEPSIPEPTEELVRNLHPQAMFPTIAINIQLQLPETDNPDVYDNLFRSLRKNLLTPSDDNE